METSLWGFQGLIFEAKHLLVHQTLAFVCVVKLRVDDSDKKQIPELFFLWGFFQSMAEISVELCSKCQALLVIQFLESFA